MHKRLINEEQNNRKKIPIKIKHKTQTHKIHKSMLLNDRQLINNKQNNIKKINNKEIDKHLNQEKMKKKNTQKT